jgi:hypothetical protein
MQEAVNERETGKMLSHVGTRPLLQDGSWPETCLLPVGQIIDIESRQAVVHFLRYSRRGKARRIIKIASDSKQRVVVRKACGSYKSIVKS